MRFLVTFVSPKRSASTLAAAAEHARSLGAEVVVLKVVPDAHKVGVVAELITTDRPTQKAAEQVGNAVKLLDQEGIATRGVVRVDQVSEGIVRAAIEFNVDAVYMGTSFDESAPRLLHDPIARYVLEHCPASVVLIREVHEAANTPSRSSRDTQASTVAQVPSYSAPDYWRTFKYKRASIITATLVFLFAFALLFSNTGPLELGNSDSLTAGTAVTLMDWHISGLWVINSPVAWVRVTNYNDEPVKDVTFEYKTYNVSGALLDTGTFQLDGTVAAHSTKNFIELYLGLVALESERLSVRLLSVAKAR